MEKGSLVSLALRAGRGLMATDIVMARTDVERIANKEDLLSVLTKITARLYTCSSKGLMFLVAGSEVIASSPSSMYSSGQRWDRTTDKPYNTNAASQGQQTPSLAKVNIGLSSCPESTSACPALQPPGCPCRPCTMEVVRSVRPDLRSGLRFAALKARPRPTCLDGGLSE